MQEVAGRQVEDLAAFSSRAIMEGSNTLDTQPYCSRRLDDKSNYLETTSALQEDRDDAPERYKGEGSRVCMVR